MSIVVLNQIARLQIQISQYARNGKQVPAELQARLAEAIDSAAWLRTKAVFSKSTPIAAIPNSTSTSPRARWRFAWHSGPYTRTLLVWMQLAPQDDGTPESTNSPYGILEVATRASPGTVVAQAKVAWGSASSHYDDVPLNFGGGTVLLVDPADGVTPVDLTPDTDYVVTISDVDHARIMSCTAWEVAIDPDTDEGYANLNTTASSPIYDLDRSAPALMHRNLWLRGAQQLYNWSSETDATAPTRTAATSYINIDDSSTTPSASTVGFYLDLRNRTTVSRSPNVPIRLWVCATTASMTTNPRVRIVDSGGSVVADIEIDVNNVTAEWFVETADLPATLAKYDLHFNGPASGSVKLLAVCIGEYAL